MRRLIALGLFCAAALASASNFKSQWEYKVEKPLKGEPVTSSTRYSLLVANPGTKTETRLEVKSFCKMTPSEARYGNCEHEINIPGRKRTLVIKEGEDIGLVYLSSNNGTTDPILGALQYGCCAGPSRVTLFNLNGDNLGTIETFERITPVIDQVWIFHNVDDHGSALVLEGPTSGDAQPKYVLLTYKAPGHYQKEPVKVALPKDVGNCLGWTVEQYTQYLDHPNPELALTSYECEPTSLKGPCEKKGAEWVCQLSKIPQP